MTIYINDKPIQAREGQSVLDAALEAGVYIPHLCSHPDLEAKGGCRLCAVEIDGAVVPACKTEATEGLRVSLNSDGAEHVRRTAMELILATHPADCTGCPKYGKCELQSLYQYMGVSAERWRKKSRPVPNDDSNPLIQHLFTRCIRCGRCIRACHDLRGVGVLDYIQSDVGIRAGIPGGKTLAEAGCRFCGACIEVCPTGSIMDQVKLMREDRSYADNLVPCRNACPAQIDIPRYIRYIKEGDFDKAAAVIRERVPFPEVLGSVCTHACEDVCKRGELGSPMSICRLKRAAGHEDSGAWKARARRDPPTGKRVAVVGSGPAGLTAAYYLCRKGHEVTVFEKLPKAGGQCRYGIPSYRLSDELLDREIAVVTEAGADIRTNTAAPAPQALLDEGYQAVLVSTGTHQGTKLPLEGNDLPEVFVNADFLRAVRMGEPMPVGERVMVLGGGSVAYDCARTALRLGAKEVHMACLENEQQMTASREEIEEGAAEGVILHAAHSFLRITGTDHVEGVELQQVERFYFDENHRAVVELVEGSQQVIPVDTVIFAVGQRPEGTADMGLELTHGPYIRTDDALRTSMDGVFAAGDVVTGTRTVIEAIAGGRRAAEEIDRYLGGDGDIHETLLDEEPASPYLGKREDFASLPRIEAQQTGPSTRILGFEPVEAALTCEQAQCEASRCLQCNLRLQLTRPKLWNEYGGGAAV